MDSFKRICSTLPQYFYVVLGAHGCGAFRNPAKEVAKLYAQALEMYADYFVVVAFAIFNPGYGPDNYTPFARQFGEAM